MMIKAVGSFSLIVLLVMLVSLVHALTVAS